MTDFSNLTKLEVTGDSTAEYKLIEIESEPVLILKPASESNAKYFNALLREHGAAKGGRKAKVKIDNKLVAKMREQDKKLYPKYVVAGWTGMLDAKGKDVPFSVEACEEFFAVLPNWIFDGIREFATMPESFVKQIDSAGKAKN